MPYSAYLRTEQPQVMDALSPVRGLQRAGGDELEHAGGLGAGGKTKLMWRGVGLRPSYLCLETGEYITPR